MHKLKVSSPIFTLLLIVCLYFCFPGSVMASPLTSVQDRLERLNDNTDSGHSFYFVTPSGVTAGETVVITFPTGIFTFGGSYDYTDMTLAEGTTNDCDSATFNSKTLAGTPSGATWGAVYSSDVVTFTSGTDTITADRCVRVELNTNGGVHALTNPDISSNTSYTINITAGSGSDEGYAAVVILPDAGTPDSDQIEIRANLVTAISFDLDVSLTNCENSTETTTPSNTVDFGTLSPGSPSSSGASINFVCIDVGTNSNGGVRVYVQSEHSDTSGGLDNVATADVIDSATANLNSGAVAEGYGLRISSVGTPATGSFTAMSPFDSGTIASVGAIPGASSTPAGIVGSTVVSETGDSSRIAAELSAKASVSTAAGTYTDTLHFTATINF